LQLSQRRFRYLPSSDDGDVRWQVPILLRASVGGSIETRKLLLTDASTTIDLGGKVEWVVVNAGGSGFWRTRYDSELLRRLTADLAAVGLDAIERYNLVSDTWATVWAGMAPLADFIELVRLFGDETDPTVWSAIVGPMRLFASVSPDDEARAGLEAFVRELLQPAFERVGWRAVAGEGEQVPTLRATLLHTLGTVGADPEVRAEAARLHAAYLEDRTAVDPDVVPALISIVAQTGGEAEYSQFLDRYRNGATPQEVVRYLMALADFPNEALVRRTIDLVDSGEVRTQNAPYVLSAALANRKHGRMVWEWVKEHWDELLTKFPDNSHSRMVETVSSLHDPAVAADVRSFLEAHPIKAGQKTVEQTLERLDVNVAFREREGERLNHLL
jgi:puromycin-sensitive aminopeptidase